MKSHRVNKLQDTEIAEVYGGNELFGKSLEVLGSVFAVSGALGFVASEITSTVYVLKANKALNAGNISEAGRLNGNAQRAKIAALSCGAGLVAGVITFAMGEKVVQRDAESKT